MQSKETLLDSHIILRLKFLKHAQKARHNLLMKVEEVWHYVLTEFTYCLGSSLSHHELQAINPKDVLTLESLSLSTMNFVTSSMFSLIISRQESGSLMNPRTLIAAFLSNGLEERPNF
jgi:hypothetical protein